MAENASASNANDVQATRSRGRRRVWNGLKVAVALGVAGIAMYWMRFAPVPVTDFVVKPGLISAEVMGTGTLEARISATISPKISGRIVAVLVDQGDRVDAGQVLFRLDDSDLKRQVEIAENTLTSSHRAVERQHAEIERAAASLSLARIEYRRVEELIPKESATSIELDRVTESLHIAEADLRRAEAALAESTSQVAVAESTVDYQRARLADTVVTAPFGGLIAHRDRDPGAVVVPGAGVLLLLSLDELWIRAWVDETEMARLQPEQPARVSFRSEPGKSYPGHVTRLGREADRETREFLVDVRVDALPENWAVGQRAEVYIETARVTDALAVPARAVIWWNGRAGAFVDQSGCAAWRELRLGLHGAEVVEVQEGLAAGERIVLPRDAAAKLRDGQRVKVR